MKIRTLLAALIALTIVACNQQPAKSPIEGAWKLIYMQYTDSVVHEFPANFSGTMTKMWCGNRFAVAGKFLQDSTTIYDCVTGTFSLDGEKYTENIESHSFPEYEGKTQIMKVVIKNDTLTQIWPVNEKGEPVEKASIEKYVRY